MVLVRLRHKADKFDSRLCPLTILGRHHRHSVNSFVGLLRQTGSAQCIHVPVVEFLRPVWKQTGHGDRRRVLRFTCQERRDCLARVVHPPNRGVGVGGRESRQIPELVLLRRSQIYGLFKNLYGLLRHAGLFVGPSQIFKVPAFVKRIEPDCLRYLLDCLFRLADKDQEIGLRPRASA